MKKDIALVRIVIIEDDQEKRDELLEILRDIGFRLNNIMQTKYAEKGIELINDELPDIVLLDLKLPYNPDNESISINNSNKVIKEVERLNAVRNQEECSTGIIIISASIDDYGLQRHYKDVPEVVDFFDKDEIALNEEKFKEDLLTKINQAVDRDFKHVCKIDINDIRHIKIKKLETIHEELYNRISTDLFGQFQKLNNKNVNTYLIVEGVIGLSGKIVEDIINLSEDKAADLTLIDDSDNFNSVRDRLNKLTGRNWNHYDKRYNIKGKAVYSRKAAEYARFAYQLRSEALHSKEKDSDNKKYFVGSKYTIEDASVSISLIMPLINEFVKFMSNK